MKHRDEASRESAQPREQETASIEGKKPSEPRGTAAGSKGAAKGSRGYASQDAIKEKAMRQR